MRKSADAFRTISEVAEELNVPKHVLRFWEIKFPHIRPMKRGGGRRYYRPAVSAGQQISAAKSKSKAKSRLKAVKRASDGVPPSAMTAAQLQAIEAAVQQLEECRKLLKGSASPTKAENKARGRSARL